MTAAVGSYVESWRRERRLSSSARSGRFARDRVWTLIAAYARRHVLLVIGAMLLPVAASGLGVLFESGTTRWVLLTVGATSGVWLGATVVLLFSGAPAILMGLLAEQQTAEILRSMRSHGWRLINGARLLPGCDLDHVLVGPRGLAIIETKWSADIWWDPRRPDASSRFMKARVHRTTDFVRRQQRDLKGLLAPHLGALSQVGIGGVVVLTGPGAVALPAEHREDDGVTVLRSDSLVSWLLDGPRDRLDAAGVDRLWREIAAAELPDADDPVPDRATLPAWFWQNLGGPLVAGMLSLLTTSAVLTLRPWGLWSGGLAAELVLGLFTTRFRHLRATAAVWIATEALALLAVLILELVPL